MRKITYSQVGDDYETKDPVKLLIQKAARKTIKNFSKKGCTEISETRGESAFVWKQGNLYMASVVEGLGTKNLIADDMYELTGKTYYDVIAHDTVATIINDLITVGAAPLVLHAYWAIEENSWLSDTKRMRDFINGWEKACAIAKVVWGGGETATMQQVLIKNTAEFAGSAVGMISSQKRLILGKNLKIGDKIILLKSSGVNANGISLARAIVKKLPKGYATKMASGQTYGEGLLIKSNIYAKLIQDIQDKHIDIHYVSNITGHGFRKIMRAKANFTYRITNLFETPEVFSFIQKHAGLSDYEMYGTYNMGMDYALFVSPKDVLSVQRTIAKNGFKSIVAGTVEKGPRSVVIEPKGITFDGKSLRLR